MPKLTLVSLKDTATQSFGSPFVVPHINLAIREFAFSINTPTTECGKYPSDYELYSLADFDDQSGALTLYESPQLLSRGKDLIQSKN